MVPVLGQILLYKRDYWPGTLSRWEKLVSRFPDVRELTFPADSTCQNIYEGISESFRTGCLEQELQMVRLSATRCSCITIL